MPLTYLALGSNIGDASAQLSQACSRLISRGVFSEQTFIQSPIYASKAMLPKGAPLEWDRPFCNQVVAGEVSMLSDILLSAIKQIEQEMGRQDRGRWGPREIDIDIIDYGQQVMESDVLTLPHPHMQTRDFVLMPLHDIAPDWVHPVSHRSLAELISALPDVTCRVV